MPYADIGIMGRQTASVHGRCASRLVPLPSARTYNFGVGRYQGFSGDFFASARSASRRRTLFASGRSAATTNPHNIISHVASAAHHNRSSRILGIRSTPQKSLSENVESVAQQSGVYKGPEVAAHRSRDLCDRYAPLTQSALGLRLQPEL